MQNAEYFNYFASTVTNDATCMGEIKSRIATAKAAFTKKKDLFTRKFDLNLKKKLIQCYMWSIAKYGTGTSGSR